MSNYTLTSANDINSLFYQLERLSSPKEAAGFMYMHSIKKGKIGSRSIIDHKFKHIITRQYITIVQAYRSHPAAGTWNNEYSIKGIK